MATLKSKLELAKEIQVILQIRTTFNYTLGAITTTDFSKFTDKELYAHIIKVLTPWYKNLKELIEDEEFELCAKLKDVIDLMKSEFYTLICTYRTSNLIKQLYYKELLEISLEELRITWNI